MNKQCRVPNCFVNIANEDDYCSTHDLNDKMNPRVLPNTVEKPTSLDPNDPIEKVLIQIVLTNRKKRTDYARDGDIFSNFKEAAHAAGVEPEQGIEYMIGTKQARLVALRNNGRKPENESVYDTMLDRAVYSIIALAYIND